MFKHSLILVNDIFDELREENNRLINELCFEKNINNILENFRNYSLIIRNNCKCDQNIDIFDKLNQLEIEYKNVKNCENNELFKIENSFNTNDSHLNENTNYLTIETMNETISNRSQQNNNTLGIVFIEII